MDVNTILTIFGAPADCKDLILALATGMRDLREQNRTLARELESAQMALESMTAAHDMLLDDIAVYAVSEARALEQVPGVGATEADPNEGRRVRVTLAGPWLPNHNGTIEGIPRWDTYFGEDHIPWKIDYWHAGTNSKNDPEERIIAVELL